MRVATGAAWRGYLSERRWSRQLSDPESPNLWVGRDFHTARVMFVHGQGWSNSRVIFAGDLYPPG
jgi:hypothetical protein